MTATESLRHPWLRPRPPLPAPPARQEQEEEEEEEEEEESASSSPSPAPPSVDVDTSPVAASVDDSITEADVISTVELPAAERTDEIPDPLVGQPVPDTEIPETVNTEETVPAAEMAVPLVEEVLPVVQQPVPVVEQITLATEQAVPADVQEMPAAEQPNTVENIVVPVAQQDIPIVEKPVPVVQQNVPEVKPVAKKPAPVLQKPIPIAKKTSPMFERALFVARKSVAEKTVAKKPVPVVQPKVTAKKPVPEVGKPTQNAIGKKSVPAEVETPIQVVQQTSVPAAEKFVPVAESPAPVPLTTTESVATKPDVSMNPTASPTKEIHPAPEDILQVAKVNLRQFVERWNSHPNSPFQLSSDSPRRTISLLISASPSQREASPTSLTGMSPSPPSSLPMSPMAKNQPTVVFDSSELTEIYETNHVVVEANRMSVQQQTTAPSSNASVETAIEQTSALLKSVKESLIRQMESGTAVRDRTGARVWERKGSGISIGSPGPASLIIQNRAKAAQMASAIADSRPELKEEPVKPESVEEAFNFVALKKQEASSIEDWEIHPPVAAKTFGFAKRHKTVSTVTVVTASEELASSYSLSSSSSTTMESHQP